MRKKVLTGCAWLLAGVLLISSSCKKSEDPAPPAATSTTTTTTTDANPEKTSSSDESDVQAAADGALNDANTTLSTTGGLNKMESAGIKGAVIDSTNKASGIITITYNGSGEDTSKTKTGVMVLKRLTSAARWADKGASYLISFNELKITKKSNGKSIVLNGSKTFTNVNGGRVADLFNTTITNPPAVIFKAKGSLNITFEDGTKRSWYVARKTTYSRSSGDITIKLEGDTSYNNARGVVEFGTNRNGETFYNVLSIPIESRLKCGLNKPVAGVRNHLGARAYTMTFGLDASGQAVTAGTCPTTRTYKIDYFKDSLPKSLIVTN